MKLAAGVANREYGFLRIDQYFELDQFGEDENLIQKSMSGCLLVIVIHGSELLCGLLRSR
jgi:hypothetical protein